MNAPKEGTSKFLKKQDAMDSRTSWDAFSKDYEDKVFSVTSSRARRMMFLKYLRPGLVLNLGTGSLPHMNQELITANFMVIASDISSQMINESSTFFSHKNLSFILADNVALPFKHGRFDSVLSINSILPETRSQVDQMLSEVHRILKKTGTFVGFFPSWETSLKARDRLGLKEILDEENIRIYETTGWQSYQTKETLSNHLKRARFSEFRIIRVFLKSKAEIASLRRIYGVDTRGCIMFEHLGIAVK